MDKLKNYLLATVGVVLFGFVLSTTPLGQAAAELESRLSAKEVLVTNGAGQAVPVHVKNFPTSQVVSGAVDVRSMPPITGSVNVTNFPPSVGSGATGVTHMGVPARQHVMLLGQHVGSGNLAQLGLARIHGDGTIDEPTNTPPFVGAFGPPSGFSLVVTDFRWSMGGLSVLTQAGSLGINMPNGEGKTVYGSAETVIAGRASHEVHFTAGLVVNFPARLEVGSLPPSADVTILGYLVADPQ